MEDTIQLPGKQGHTRVSSNVLDSLNKIAKEFKITRSKLVQQVLESFCKHYDDAVLTETPFIKVEQVYEQWIKERRELNDLLKIMRVSNEVMAENTKSPEFKLVSQQNETLSKMINLLHKIL
tara:strand:+ start:123 stop:488 length:366 start_codon:yes stop_codon:yes gene_type:complete